MTCFLSIIAIGCFIYIGYFWIHGLNALLNGRPK
jgi:hypothetical protein